MDPSHLPAAAFAAREFNVGVSVNVCVLSTHVAITCPANTALTYTQKMEKQEHLLNLQCVMGREQPQSKS